VYQRFSPLVVDQSQTADVVLEVKVVGAPTSVRLQLQSTGGEVFFRDDGTDPDRVAGDEIYTVRLRASDVLLGFTPDDVNRNFVGFLRFYSGTQRTGDTFNIFADIGTADLPTPSGIRTVSNDLQYTDHLVNIVDASFFNKILQDEDLAIRSIIRRFYSSFPDDFDFINVVSEISFFANRYHVLVRNDIRGIGTPMFDTSATYGSGGRLLGYTVFPIPTFFDGASPTHQHELGHQWINDLPVPPLNLGIPHWPLSDLASDIMGYGTDEGLDFSFNLVPEGGNFRLVPDNSPKVYNDLSLYLMGLLPANQVKPHFVFNSMLGFPRQHFA